MQSSKFNLKVQPENAENALAGSPISAGEMLAGERSVRQAGGRGGF